MIEKLDHCEDEGTALVKIPTRIDSRGHGIYVYDQNVTLGVPLDENLAVSITCSNQYSFTHVNIFMFIKTLPLVLDNYLSKCVY